MHRLAFALAGKATGPRKRIFRRLQAEQLTTETIVDYMKKPGAEGGMSAMEVEWPKVAEDYRREFTELVPRYRAAHEHKADDDLRRVTWRLRKTPKRKAAVEWSLPVGILLMAIRPDYVSVGSKARK